MKRGIKRLSSVGAPVSSDPLRQAIARKMRLLMKMRGQNYNDVATATGLVPGHIAFLISGKGTLNQEICRRLLMWFRNELPTTPMEPLKTRKMRGLRKAAVWLEPQLAARVQTTAAHFYMTVPQFLHLCVQRFMANDSGLTTYAKMAKELRQARAVQMLKDVPELQELLEFDMKLAKALGEREPVKVDQTPKLADMASNELCKELGVPERKIEEHVTLNRECEEAEFEEA